MPEKSFIPLAVPVVRGNEWTYVKDCLDTGWVSCVGSYVDRFEKTVADYTGRKYCVATSSGTAALHLSLLAGGVGPDDEVLLPTLTFVATANAVVYCGARPVFLDCEARTLCLDPDKLESFLREECEQQGDKTVNRESGRTIRAVISVDVFGHPCDMNRLQALCREFHLLLVADAAESLGSRYRGDVTGRFGDLSCFSFNGNKIITTGGGGMVLTDNEDWGRRVRHLSTQAKADSVEYYHDEVGYNYRLGNVQAALGIGQFEYLEEYLAVKRGNAALYRELLEDVKEVRMLDEKDWAQSNAWFYTLRTSREHVRPLLRHLMEQGIQGRPVWQLMHTLPMYASARTYRIEEAVRAYEECFNIPCSVDLTKSEIERVASTIRTFPF